MGNTAAVTVCVMLATVMQALDTTIANVALPYMQGTLAATTDQINWVLTSYIVAAAIMTPPTGFLAARFGRKRLLLAAVAGFTLASVLCGIAASLGQIVAFRLLQGVFGAPLVPLSQAVLLDSYPCERHGQAMAMWGIGVMVGPILGPLLGGWLTANYDWRWVFFINLPVGIAAFLGLSAVLEESPREPGLGFDWFGFSTLSLAIGALQMLLDRGQDKDWFSSPEIVVEAVLAGTAFALFLIHLLTAERPFIQPKMFRDRNLVAGLTLIFAIGIILLATLALLTPFVQDLLDWPVLTAGMVMAPRGLGTMIAMFLVGRLIARVDARLLMAVGLLLIAVSLWQMTGFDLTVDPAILIKTGIVQGLGLGFVFVPLSTMTFATLEPSLRTQAAALYSLMRNIGSSIGISVVIFLLARNTQAMHASLASNLTPYSLPLRGVPAWSGGGTAALEALNAAVTRQAALVAYLDDFWLMMVVALAMLPLLLLLKQPARRAEAVSAALE